MVLGMELATNPQTGAIITPRVKVVVHPTRKGWTWTQVSRNGSAGALAPKTYDSKSNAIRAGKRQVATLDPAVPQGEASVHVAFVVRDTDPGYV